MGEDNKYIYHYTKLATAIEFILPKMQLRLNKLSSSNDPRENRGRLFLHLRSNEINSIIDLGKEINKKVFNNSKYISFSSDESAFKGYQLSNMWAHYGHNHKGVCLKINREKFLFYNKKICEKYAQKICYIEPSDTKGFGYFPQIDSKNVTNLSNTTYLFEFMDCHKDLLFFKKTIEWKFEQEFRVIFLSNEIKNEYCCIKDSLESIYFGCDFDENYYPSIKKLIIGKNINIEKLHFDENSGSEKLQIFKSYNFFLK